jgi:hypothetical protein
MDIGPPRRTFEVEPVSVPIPTELPLDEPAPAPTPSDPAVEPQPAERVDSP